MLAPDRSDETAQRLAAIVESSDDAIVSKDLDGIVMSWNGAAERLFGYRADEMIGRSIRAIIPADRQGEEDAVLAAVRRGDKVDHFETVRQRKDGSFVPISLTVSPIKNAAGAVIGASKIARDISDRLEADRERTRLLAIAEANRAVAEKLNQVGTLVAATLDRSTVVQSVTDGATDLTGAEFGAFFYNVVDQQSGASYLLYTLSGAPREAFANFSNPRATPIFGPTFRGEGIVRLDDVTKDPRYGTMAPHYGMPEGHLPVRSYLAAPVRGRSGEVLGGLFFGHSQPGVFTAEHEQLVQGVAGWASLALENARLYDSAQEASRLKDEFLATLSHELRTPLNAILGYTRMIRMGFVQEATRGRAIETVERNALSLAQIVEDILDVSRIIAGKIRLNVQAIDVWSLVTDAIDTVRPAAAAKGVEIEATGPADASPFLGDRERLQQVVWNLLANAVKFTERGGTVSVRLARTQGSLELVVADTGVGISGAFLPFIFERFRQADAGTTRERGGLGLGLSIARHFVELHGGTIEAISEGVGKGTTFVVRLPEGAAPEIVPGSGESLAAEPPEAAEAADDRIQVPDLSGVRVLVVDEDGDARELTREVIEATGAEVVTAASGTAALAALATFTPDVIVAEVALPDMDGRELIRQVRTHDRDQVRAVPAAALTAIVPERSNAAGSGFELHLTKPIDPRELMVAVASLAHRP